MGAVADVLADAERRAKGSRPARAAFCMGAAWRSAQGSRSSMQSATMGRRACAPLGLETCATPLGMLDRGRRRARLERTPGSTYYNHNLDNPRPSITGKDHQPPAPIQDPSRHASQRP